MAPVHQLHALLHADILRFVARCQHEMEGQASVPNAAACGPHSYALTLTLAPCLGPSPKLNHDPKAQLPCYPPTT